MHEALGRGRPGDERVTAYYAAQERAREERENAAGRALVARGRAPIALAAASGAVSAYNVLVSPGGRGEANETALQSRR
jgi:hypothetical protein